MKIFPIEEYAANRLFYVAGALITTPAIGEYITLDGIYAKRLLEIGGFTTNENEAVKVFSELVSEFEENNNDNT